VLLIYHFAARLPLDLGCRKATTMLLATTWSLTGRMSGMHGWRALRVGIS
jgi:hypothetical protein